MLDRDHCMLIWPWATNMQKKFSLVPCLAFRRLKKRVGGHRHVLKWLPPIEILVQEPIGEIFEFRSQQFKACPVSCGLHSHSIPFGSKLICWKLWLIIWTLIVLRILFVMQKRFWSILSNIVPLLITSASLPVIKTCFSLCFTRKKTGIRRPRLRSLKRDDH